MTVSQRRRRQPQATSFKPVSGCPICCFSLDYACNSSISSRGHSKVDSVEQHSGTPLATSQTPDHRVKLVRANGNTKSEWSHFLRFPSNRMACRKRSDTKQSEKEERGELACVRGSAPKTPTDHGRGLQKSSGVCVSRQATRQPKLIANMSALLAAQYRALVARGSSSRERSGGFVCSRFDKCRQLVGGRCRRCHHAQQKKNLGKTCGKTRSRHAVLQWCNNNRHRAHHEREISLKEKAAQLGTRSLGTGAGKLAVKMGKRLKSRCPLSEQGVRKCSLCRCASSTAPSQGRQTREPLCNSKRAEGQGGNGPKASIK